jgi:hypothetical protein
MGGFWISRRSWWSPKVPMSVRRHSVAVIARGWKTEVRRAERPCWCGEPRRVRVRSPKGSSHVETAGELPGEFSNPKVLMEPGGSDERPKMLGRASEEARWRSHALGGEPKFSVHRVLSKRAPEGSRVLKLPMNTRRCSLEATRFRRHTGDA